jgi:hypothetical protein
MIFVDACDPAASWQDNILGRPSNDGTLLEFSRLGQAGKIALDLTGEPMNTNFAVRAPDHQGVLPSFAIRNSLGRCGASAEPSRGPA